MSVVKRSCRIVMPTKDSFVLNEILKDKYQDYLDNIFLEFYRKLIKLKPDQFSASKKFNIPGRNDVSVTLKSYNYNGGWDSVHLKLNISKRVSESGKTYFIEMVEETINKQIEDKLLNFNLSV